jgi:hypothetical protein
MQCQSVKESIINMIDRLKNEPSEHITSSGSSKGTPQAVDWWHACIELLKNL